MVMSNRIMHQNNKRKRITLSMIFALLIALSFVFVVALQNLGASAQETLLDQSRLDQSQDSPAVPANITEESTQSPVIAYSQQQSNNNFGGGGMGGSFSGNNSNFNDEESYTLNFGISEDVVNIVEPTASSPITFYPYGAEESVSAPLTKTDKTYTKNGKKYYIYSPSEAQILSSEKQCIVINIQNGQYVTLKWSNTNPDDHDYIALCDNESDVISGQNSRFSYEKAAQQTATFDLNGGEITSTQTQQLEAFNWKCTNNLWQKEFPWNTPYYDTDAADFVKYPWYAIIPTKFGAMFTSWSNADKALFEDTTYKAQYDTTDYTLTFTADDGISSFKNEAGNVIENVTVSPSSTYKFKVIPQDGKYVGAVSCSVGTIKTTLYPDKQGFYTTPLIENNSSVHAAAKSENTFTYVFEADSGIKNFTTAEGTQLADSVEVPVDETFSFKVELKEPLITLVNKVCFMGTEGYDMQADDNGVYTTTSGASGNATISATSTTVVAATFSLNSGNITDAQEKSLSNDHWSYDETTNLWEKYFPKGSTWSDVYDPVWSTIIPTYSGHHFIGWKNDGIDPGNTIMSEVPYTAYEAKYVEVTDDSDIAFVGLSPGSFAAGSKAPDDWEATQENKKPVFYKIFKKGTEIDAIIKEWDNVTIQAPEGMSFDKWNYNDHREASGYIDIWATYNPKATISLNGGSIDDKDIPDQWIKETYDGKVYYSKVFDLDTEYSEILLQWDTAKITPPAGQVFNGWTKHEGKLTENTLISANYGYPYTYTFEKGDGNILEFTDLDGNVLGDKITVIMPSTLKFKVITADGYMVDKVTYTIGESSVELQADKNLAYGMRVSFPGDATIKATSVESRTATFNLCGGTITESDKYNLEINQWTSTGQFWNKEFPKGTSWQEIYSPVWSNITPTYPDYTFLGWENSGEPLEINMMYNAIFAEFPSGSGAVIDLKDGTIDEENVPSGWQWNSMEGVVWYYKAFDKGTNYSEILNEWDTSKINVPEGKVFESWSPNEGTLGDGPQMFKAIYSSSSEYTAYMNLDGGKIVAEYVPQGWDYTQIEGEVVYWKNFPSGTKYDYILNEWSDSEVHIEWDEPAEFWRWDPCTGTLTEDATFTAKKWLNVTVQGRVINSDGSPIENAEVCYWYSLPDSLNGTITYADSDYLIVRVGLTDAKGHFDINLPKDICGSFEINADGYKTYTKDNVIFTEDIIMDDIVLEYESTDPQPTPEPTPSDSDTINVNPTGTSYGSSSSSSSSSQTGDQLPMAILCTVLVTVIGVLGCYSLRRKTF